LAVCVSVCMGTGGRHFLEPLCVNMCGCRSVCACASARALIVKLARVCIERMCA